MALTRDQFQELRDKGLTVDQIVRFEGGEAPRVQETNSKSLLRPQELVSSVGEDIGRQFQSSAQDIQQSTQRLVDEPSVSNLGRTIFTGLAQGAQAGIGSAFDIGFSAASALTPDFIEDPVRRVAGSAVEKVVGSEPVQKVIGAVEEKFDELAPENQQLVKDLGDAGLTAVDFTAFRALPKAVKTATTKVDDVVTKAPKTPKAINDKIIDTRTAAYTKSFLDDSKVVTKKLEELAAKASRGDTKFTKTALLKELAEEGYSPKVEGKLGNFTDVFKDIQKRQAALAETNVPKLERVKTTVPVQEIESIAESVLRNSPAVGSEITKSLAELKRFGKGFTTKYGDDLTAKNVDQIRKEMNAKTKAFKDDVFKQDTADAVADAARQIIERVAPSTKEARAEIARLFRLKETAQVLHLQAISVPKLVTQMGGMMGVLLAAGLGLSVAGPGGLIIAGMVAHYGGEVVAALLRSSRFKFKKELVDLIKSDEKLLKKVMDDASGDDKNLLKQFFEDVKDTPNRKGGFIKAGRTSTLKYTDENGKKRVLKDLTDQDLEDWTQNLEDRGITYDISKK